MIILSEKYIEGARQRLADSDYRLTPQRQAILQVLVDNREGHLSADDVYMKAKEKHPDVGLATVYRTLELFEKLGIVYRLDYGDGQARYEYNDGVEEHYHHHLICLSCGRIQEFNYDLLDDIEKIISSKTNFKIVDHCLRIFGYCAECSSKQENGGRDPKETD